MRFESLFFGYTAHLSLAACLLLEGCGANLVSDDESLFSKPYDKVFDTTLANSRYATLSSGSDTIIEGFWIRLPLQESLPNGSNISARLKIDSNAVQISFRCQKADQTEVKTVRYSATINFPQKQQIGLNSGDSVDLSLCGSKFEAKPGNILNYKIAERTLILQGETYMKVAELSDAPAGSTSKASSITLPFEILGAYDYAGANCKMTDAEIEANRKQILLDYGLNAGITISQTKNLVKLSKSLGSDFYYKVSAIQENIITLRSVDQDGHEPIIPTNDTVIDYQSSTKVLRFKPDYGTTSETCSAYVRKE